MMSCGRTLHRADVMHACYSVSAIAMKAQKASWRIGNRLRQHPQRKPHAEQCGKP